MSRCHLIFLISFLICLENFQIACFPSTIIPSTIHGLCTVCNTSSCSNCQKLTNIQVIERKEDGVCSACTKSSAFCQALDNDDGTFTNCLGNCSPIYSAFIPRSQGSNTARELAGWEEFIHQYDLGEFYLTSGHVVGYTRSFRPERIARFLFGDTVVRFAGSQVVNRGPCELLADNFGLSPTFRGSISLEPLIENILFDNHFFIGLDPIACGLYARIHLPLVHTRWNLRACQVLETEEKNCSTFPACYIGGDEVPASCDILQSIGGMETIADIQPWLFGHINTGLQTKTAVADIDLIIGYNFRQNDISHLGFYGQLVVPTGNRFTGKSLFQPMVGNAHHVELGLGFSGHYILLDYDAENSLAFHMEANVVHLFKNTQMRSFDLCGQGPLSRYMLLKELDENFNYTGRLVNAIDVTTRPVSVSITAKADLSAKLAIRTSRLIADIGYNFFGQTREKVQIHDFVDKRNFVIKGTEGVCGLEYSTLGDPPSFGSLVRTIPLNSSQSNATIRQGAITDNPQAPDVMDPSNIIVTSFSRQEGPTTGTDVILANVSVPPILIAKQSLHKATGSLPAQATHKVFGYLGYNFYELDWCANPYIGIGGEAEFDARSKDEQTALNQWSIWVKWGFEF